jgi:UPF0288 family protein (methanogenesis marker protein 3)|tara:strand:- start:526 stop:861 length:336 start_codon:yes stop_codon:yes gene_type:complete
MANKLGEAPATSEWTSEEKENMVQSYGCHLIAEGATPEQIQDKKLPTDTLQIKYKFNDKVSIDLCRGKKVDVFDLYYDKFGKESLISIDWAHGTVSPKMWGYKPPEKKKRK